MNRMSNAKGPRRHDPALRAFPPVTLPTSGSATQLAATWEARHGANHRLYRRSEPLAFKDLPLREREEVYAELHYTFFSHLFYGRLIRVADGADGERRQSHAMVGVEVLPWLVVRRRDQYRMGREGPSFGSEEWHLSITELWDHHTTIFRDAVRKGTLV